LREIERIFAEVEKHHVQDAIKYARTLEALGQSIVDLPGSGPSRVHFIEEKQELFPAKATLRYAMTLAGIDVTRRDRQFYAGQATTFLGRLGFQLCKLEGSNSKSDQTIEVRITNRNRRLAEIWSRPNQATFRRLVLENFNWACCVSESQTRAVLQAAHIVPVSHSGTDNLDNGLLLRSDIHLLFDIGALDIDPQTLRVSVDNKIAPEYSKYSGKRLKIANDANVKKSLDERKRLKLVF
jgi:hypothetical protein